MTRVLPESTNARFRLFCRNRKGLQQRSEALVNFLCALELIEVKLEFQFIVVGQPGLIVALGSGATVRTLEEATQDQDMFRRALSVRLYARILRPSCTLQTHSGPAAESDYETDPGCY